MKNIMKNIKNAVVKFFIHIFLIILYILEGLAYSVECFCKYGHIILYIALIIFICYANDPVRY